MMEAPSPSDRCRAPRDRAKNGAGRKRRLGQRDDLNGAARGVEGNGGGAQTEMRRTGRGRPDPRVHGIAGSLWTSSSQPPAKPSSHAPLARSGSHNGGTVFSIVIL